MGCDDTYNYFDGPTTKGPEPESPRKKLLDDAITAIVGDRNNQYGPPNQDFQRTANLLFDLGFRIVDEDGETGQLEPYHIAMMMICLKLSRLTWSPSKRDTWLDVAGYAGCGWEVFDESSS